MSEFEVDGPTPGLCIHIERRLVCTRMLGHDGEHILVPDTLTSEERFHAIAARFPVTYSADLVQGDAKLCGNSGDADATYGTAIRKRKSKRILDVDLSFDRDEAKRIVAQQNAKKAILASRVEWVVVEIRALEPGDPS